MKKTIVSLTLILAASFVAVKPADAQVLSVGVSIRVGPPVIPVYTQPPCPVDGYIWVPGYWAYDDDEGYYWVPGYWDAPPEVGFLWTPGYWGYAGGLYSWHSGYWGPHVGYYGGIDYGCGYSGIGYVGGGWAGGHFRYNTAVTNVNTRVIHNTYIDRTVIRNTTVNRVSYHGGPGGVQRGPTSQEEQAARDRHFQATSTQMSHQHNASIDRNQFVAVNHGRPSNMAVERPREYHPANTVGSLSHGVVNRPDNHPAARPVNHPAPVNHSPAPVNRPAPRPENHAAPRPENHPAPRPENHAAPRPVNHPAPRPMPHPQQPHPQPHAQQPQQPHEQPHEQPQQPHEHHR